MKIIITVDCLFPVDRHSDKDVSDVDYVHNIISDRLSVSLASFLVNSEFDWDNDNFHITIESKEDDGNCPHCRDVTDDGTRMLYKKENLSNIDRVGREAQAQPSQPLPTQAPSPPLPQEAVNDLLRLQEESRAQAGVEQDSQIQSGSAGESAVSIPRGSPPRFG